MKKIYISDAGPKVSPAIYGFWRWNEYMHEGVAGMERIVNLCLELGINTFDHADHYGGYQCEAMFGEIMGRSSFKREDIVLFSKCGRVEPHEYKPDVRIPYYNTSAAHIQTSVENSLRNLKTDYLDIFLLDSLDPISNIEETALALDRLKTSGKIRNVGVANLSVFQHQLLASLLRTSIVTNHIDLNLLNTAALDNGQIDYIKQKFMRPLAAAPLAGGRIEAGTDPKAQRVRAKLEEIGKKYGANVESTAVAWLVKLGALPLIGTANETRIRNIVEAFAIDLDHQDWFELYQVSRES